MIFIFGESYYNESNIFFDVYMFVIIEWIDGSGKSTQIKEVTRNLQEKGKTVKIISYPRYNENSSFMVQKYLNGEYGKNVCAKQSSIFYAIDRFDSSFELKKDLESYDYVISDRYVSASMLHQAWKIKDPIERKEFLAWLEDLEYNIFSIPKPDKVLFLDVHPEISMENMESRWAEDKEYIKWGKKKDIHEEDRNHLLNAYNAAWSILNESSNWEVIECMKDKKMLEKSVITQSILNVIS